MGDYLEVAGQNVDRDLVVTPHEGSRWTHPICGECYDREQPGRVPARIKAEYAEQQECCWCGAETSEGIFYRADPEVLHG